MSIFKIIQKEFNFLHFKYGLKMSPISKIKS